jgi:hypothetical protein
MSLTDRVTKLLGEQPWPGYDEQDVGAVVSKLDHGDAEAARQVKRYERGRKDRPAVVHAAERRIDRQAAPESRS